MKIRYLICCIAVILFNACNNETDSSDFESTIIVEGEIESGNFPEVILTRNVPYYVQLDSTDFLYLVLRQAKITVSDGEKSEILTLKYSNNNFPPYYYKGNEIVGEPGKTYTLTIEYGEKTLTATTTIPNPVSLDSVWFKLNAASDSLGKIKALLKDNSNIHSYYRIFTKILSRQTEFYPTLVSVFDDKAFNGLDYIFTLSNGPESYLKIDDTEFNYILGDTVLVKIATIDENTFNFWESYQDEVINGTNPFASSNHSIISNINGEGKGIWGGYGSNTYLIVNK
jgi:hypothetical protein